MPTMHSKTPAEMRLRQLIDMGLALNPLIELCYFCQRHPETYNATQEVIDTLLITLQKIQDCLPKVLCNTQCRTQEAAFSFMFGQGDPDSLYQILTEKDTKASEVVLAYYSKKLSPLEKLCSELEQELQLLKAQGIIHVANELGPLLLPQLRKFNCILNTPIFTYPDDCRKLCAEFKGIMTSETSHPVKPDQHTTLFLYPDIQKNHAIQTKPDLRIKQVQKEIANAAETQNPTYFIELLKSYICAVANATQENEMFHPETKDIKLMHNALNFLQKHLTDSEYKKAIKEINIVIDSIKDKPLPPRKSQM